MKKFSRADAHDMIDLTFKELFPAYGLSRRDAQIELSHTMLDAMLGCNIALCDAGTGIGKTYAYLVAGIAYQKFRRHNGYSARPIIISTSSISLQEAIIHDYLPFLSKVYMEHGIMGQRIHAVLRKGKRHYVCDERLERRLRTIGKNKSEAYLTALRNLRTIDLDSSHRLSKYEQEHICVPDRCSCDRDYCRYRDFMSQCNAGTYYFQICNHNLLFADLIHRECGKPTILPARGALVVDESHKIPAVAREMFGITLRAEDFYALIKSVKDGKSNVLVPQLKYALEPLLTELRIPPKEVHFGEYVRELSYPYYVLRDIQTKHSDKLSAQSRRKLENIMETMRYFMTFRWNEDMLFYAADDENGGAMLCATVCNLGQKLNETLWRTFNGVILTSGTLAVQEDFRRFRENTGILNSGRVVESVSLSPFDYDRNCLLYSPADPVRLREGQEPDYYDATARQIRDLICNTCGHALVLFTSYAAMSAVGQRLKAMTQAFPVYMLNKNSAHTLTRFKEDPGAVLLATGSAWEGMDFPGDCVSLLVIPRLPFPMPDAIREKQREGYPDLGSFIRSVIIPDMQIKLRQGFGRAIRQEDDTCVVAILDERAVPGARYYEAMRDALPMMPETDSLDDVRAFIEDRKSEEYFREALGEMPED